MDGRRLRDDGGGVCGVSFSLSPVASGEGWPILPGPAPRGWVCSRRDSDPLTARAMSRGVVLWLMRTCDGSGSVACIVLVTLRGVRNRNCNGMSGRGRLALVLIWIDVATRIIINDCRLIAPCASMLLMCYQCDMKGMIRCYRASWRSSWYQIMLRGV